MKKQTIKSFLAAMLLASCSSEDSADLTQLSAPVPLTFNVEVGAGVSTRTDNATTEKGTNANIANGTITLYIDGNSYTYTVGGDGTVTSTSPYYYESTDDVTVTATAEYSSSDDVTNCKDYLYATTTGNVTDNGGIITLKFDHKASKLKFELKQGDDVTDTEFGNITSFSITGLVKANQLSTSDGTISLSTEAASITDRSKSYIIAPQKQENTVQASITMNNIEYKTSKFTMDLEAGESYTCNIKVSKTGINITSCVITNWNDGDTSSYKDNDTNTPIYTYGSIPYAGYSEVNQYALAFTDGSFENLMESGKLNTDKIATLNSLQLNNVCGIVYSTDDPSTNDEVLKADYPNCTHGLIVSLANAESETYKYEKKNSSSRMSWSGTDATIPYVSESSSTKNNKTGQGYKFTKYLKSYNALQSESTNKMYPVAALEEDYKETSPSGSSGWFVPSAYELVQILTIRTNLESILSALNKRNSDFSITKNMTLVFYDSVADCEYYWTSSECNKENESDRGLCVKYSDATIHTSVKTNDYYYVRPVCAF